LAPERRRDVWITGAVVLGCALFIGGVLLGKHLERQNFELMKAFISTKATDYLANGQPGKALSASHLAKAYETLPGDTDGLLARAYLANDEPCLAMAFAESHLRYVEKYKLATLPGYAKARELSEQASTKCMDFRGSGAASATAPK